MSEVELTLGAQCGVTFAGIKAASLFTVRRAEADLLPEYERHFGCRGIYFERLRTSEDRVLLYVYRRAMLQRILFDEHNRAFLRSRGYNYHTCEEAIALLKERMVREEFPHEVGLFLDYPLEDVEGFIASPREGVQICGYWKVYSDAEKKAEKFRRFRDCSRCILAKLYSGESLKEIFKALPVQAA